MTDETQQPQPEQNDQNSATLEGTLSVPILLTEDEITALAEAFAIGRKGKPYNDAEFEAIVFWASDAVFRYKMFRAVVDGVVNIDITENNELFFDITRPEQTSDAESS